MDANKKRKALLGGQFTFKDEDTVVCVHCKNEFTYHRSTSSLSYHLRTKHAFVHWPSSSAGDTSKEQPTLPEMYEKAKPMDQAKYDGITNAIAKWIAMSGRPTNIVTDDGLQNVIRVTSGNQSYTLPSRPVIDARITDLYTATKMKVKKVLEGAVHVALTADCWSSLANDSYLGVMGHTLDSDWKLHSFAMTVNYIEDRHYSAACAEHFSAAARDWNVFEKVTTFGTDNARNVTAAVAVLPFEHMPCMAHTLQLSVNKAVDESGADAVLTKCRKIVGHFKHSPANAGELRQQQALLKMKEQMLIQDVSTRWNSTLQLIERLLSNKGPVLATLSQPGHKHSLSIPSDAEFEKLRILQSLLDPFRFVTEQLGGERYVSCSVVLPAVCHLRRAMQISDDDPAYVARFKNAITTDLDSRLRNCNLPWLKMSTILDPRFKLLKCLPKRERDEVWQLLLDAVSCAEREADSKTSTYNSGMFNK